MESLTDQGHLEFFYHVMIFILLIAVAGLTVLAINYAHKSHALQNSLELLTRSFNELDEQAKLIVRTDLELNKTQEELDKRLNGLDALQKISRLISTTLDENEIFQRLGQPKINELGFEKYLLFITDKNQELQCRLHVGITETMAGEFKKNLLNNPSVMKQLNDGHILSSARSPRDISDPFSKITDIQRFILNPILIQKNFFGLIFAGNQSETFALTEGDEELISILADQVGQSIENARLFEQVYRSTQLLEMKVQERTKQLSSALEEVQKISKTKSEFISAVSHELRTPLTSIKGYASILITGKMGEIPEKVKERLEKINKHSDNLVKLINDLLDISRIESRRIEMNMLPHHLKDIIENTQDILTPQLKDKNINLVVGLDENVPHIPMDASQIERVFINLISNAIKFTPENGTITIKAIKNKNENKTTITVSDTGIGIREDAINKIFDEFYRVDNEINQNVKGTGLGLTLCKKIVEAHKGTIWLTSKVHKGSTFHFTLPCGPQID
jgi:signal transduction histidine kinase